MLENTFLKLSYSFMLHFFIISKCFHVSLSEELITYCWFCIFFTCFYFQHCFRNNITDDLKKIKVYFILTVPFCPKHDNVWHRWKAYEKINNLTYNMLKLVVICESSCHFSQHTRCLEIAKNTNTTVKRYVDELVSPRTIGHLIEKKYQVTGNYLCTKYILGCPELHFWRVCNGGIKSYGRL